MMKKEQDCKEKAETQRNPKINYCKSNKLSLQRHYKNPNRIV